MPGLGFSTFFRSAQLKILNGPSLVFNFASAENKAENPRQDIENVQLMDGNKFKTLDRGFHFFGAQKVDNFHCPVLGFRLFLESES